MKKIIALLLLVTCFSCTENVRSRNWGGTSTIKLPPGQKLVTATWKKVDLWYLTEPMEEGYVPRDKTFHESSSFGVMEGTVIFEESR